MALHTIPIASLSASRKIGSLTAILCKKKRQSTHWIQKSHNACLWEVY
jgi:hypothetical protein